MSDETSYDDFWLMYLREHSERATRLIHYLGISVIILAVIAAIVTKTWWIAVAGIAIGYLTAWFAHWVFQHNEPVVFEGPKAAFWSFMSAARMYVLAMSGQLGPELRRAGISAG